MIAWMVAIPTALAGLAFIPAAAGAVETLPTEDLLAEYSFASKPSDGHTVANTAPGSAFGEAQVQNPGDDLWRDESLVLSGGDWGGGGSWVRLPADLLSGKSSATVQMEVKADPDMLKSFHFMWNIGNASNQEYLFSSLNCAFGRQPLVGIKAKGVEHLVQSGSCPVRADQWMSVTATLDGSDGMARLYVDGEEVASGEVPVTTADIGDQSLNTIGHSPWKDVNFKGQVANFRVYGRALDAGQVRSISTVDANIHRSELVDGRIDALGFHDQSVDGDYLALPTAGGTVTWSSSDPSVITDTGMVNQPPSGAQDQTVTMTATTTVRGLTGSKSYRITVKPSTKTKAQRLQEAADGYVIPPLIASGTKLPVAPDHTRLQLQAASGISIHDGGLVSIAGDKPVSGRITARITAAGVVDPIVKDFEVKILPKSKASTLLAYDRNATSADTANNGDIAHSMHLALKDEASGRYQPYNGNYGIFFPLGYASQPVNQNTRDYARSLKDPSIFMMGDGSYGILSVRTNRGTDVPDSPGHLLFARSPDLLAYEESPNSAGLIDLGETNGVNSPYGVYDTASKTTMIGWYDDNGVPKYTSFAELKDKDSVHGPVHVGRFATVGGSQPASEVQGIDDYRNGSSMVIDQNRVKALQTRFGRLTNTGVDSFKDITVTKGSSANGLKLPKTARLTYSDGSTGSLPIRDWDTSHLDLNKVGEYEVTGTIGQTSYKVPFAEERADPSIYKWQWKRQVDGHERVDTKYLMIATNDIEGDCTWQHGSPHMPLRMADAIADLADTPGQDSGLIDANGFNAKEHIILKAGDPDAEGQPIMHSFWAPEIHEINGRLTVLFMAGYGNQWTNGKAVYMQLKQDAGGHDLDPIVASNWERPRAVTRSDGRPLALAADGSVGMSLDMSYFQDQKGQSYYVWQQLGATYLARMNPADPAHVTTDPVRIVAPDYAWNATIAEGPNVTLHQGKLYLMYSGSSVGKTYTTGMAVADGSGNTDLTNPASWSNLNYPIQNSGIFNGKWQLGTGHGMWSEDEDGNQIYVFHAYANKTDGYRNYSGRDTFVRRVHWAADGMPVLDMDANEELAHPDVKVRVKVVDSVVKVDKSGLSAALKKADGLDQGKYESGSWLAFAAARMQAQAVYDDPNADQAAVDQALKGLQEAIKALVPLSRPDGNGTQGGSLGQGTSLISADVSGHGRHDPGRDASVGGGGLSSTGTDVVGVSLAALLMVSLALMVAIPVRKSMSSSLT